MCKVKHMCPLAPHKVEEDKGYQPVGIGLRWLENSAWKFGLIFSLNLEKESRTQHISSSENSIMEGGLWIL